MEVMEHAVGGERVSRIAISRRPAETLHIGGAVLRIVRIGKKRVDLVVEAPRSVLVLRGELVKRKEIDDAQGGN